LVGLAVIVATALALRLRMPGLTIKTTDEWLWVPRSRAFGEAWQSGDFARMVVSPDRAGTRPGVTTMWTGFLGIELAERDLPGWSSDALRNGHRLMAIWCSVLIVPFVAAARRIVGRRGSLVAGGILAVEPLLVGHSALLHTDALLTMTVGVAIVGLMAAAEERRLALRQDRRWRRRWVLSVTMAGAAAGLAVLTKISALLPLGLATLMVLAVHGFWVWRSAPVARYVVRELAVLALPFAAVAAIVVVVVWPAMWVAPLNSIETSLDSLRLAGRASPRFFLGEVVVGSDWRYYPVEAVFRASAWLLVGGLAMVAWKVRARMVGAPRVLARRHAVVLTVTGLVFVVALSVSSKQYARYLLPLLPLVAVAMAAVVDRWARSLTRRLVSRGVRWGGLVAPVSLWLAFALTAAWTASLAPYQISHVNPLVGGQRTAERTIPLGWGEGFEVMTAAYRLEGGETCQTWTSWRAWILFQLCRDGRRDAGFVDGDQAPPRFVLRYVYERQLGEEPPGLQAYLDEHGTLVDSVTIDGVRYAELWEIDGAS